MGYIEFDAKLRLLANFLHVGVYVAKQQNQIVEFFCFLDSDQQVFEFIAQFLVQYVQCLRIVDFGLIGLL